MVVARLTAASARRRYCRPPTFGVRYASCLRSHNTINTRRATSTNAVRGASIGLSPADCRHGHRNHPIGNTDRASYSSVTNRLWETIRTGSFNPPNPIIVNLNEILAYRNNQQFVNEDGDDPKKLDASSLGEDYDNPPTSSYSSGHPPLPNFTQIQPYHLERAVKQIQEEYESSLSALEESITSMMLTGDEKSSNISYENVIPPLEKMEFPLRYVTQIASLLLHLQNNSETRHACQQISQTLKFQSEESEVLMKALQIIESQLVGQTEKEEASKGDEGGSKDLERLNTITEQRLRVVRHLLRKYQLKGMTLDDDEAKEKLRDLQIALREVESDFAVTTSSSFPGKSGHHHNISTSERLSDMYQILYIQNEIAKLLGYTNYADLSMKSMMAPNIQAITELHDSVCKAIMPVVTSPGASSFRAVGMEQVDVRPYLELNSVLFDGLFELTRKLFGVVIKEVNDPKDVNGWNKDVRLFHMFDEQSMDLIGSFYIDPFTRPGEKVMDREFMGHILDKSGNDSIKPVVYMSCNIRPPVWDDSPTYLTFDDVLSLFHEFGHVLQFLLANVEYGCYSGGQLIEEDASEVPSQFMEHWLFDETFLSSFAKHAQTGDTIPTSLIEKLKHDRAYQKAHEMMYRIFLGELELHLHGGKFDPRGDESIVTIQRHMVDKYMSHDPIAKSDISPLIEIFEDNAGGKQTARYRYLWSELLSADVYKMFQEAGGLEKEDEMRDIGMRFRKTILEGGGGVDSAVAFRTFLGREFSPKSLLDGPTGNSSM